MDNSFDTSFIPQQPLLKVEGSLRRKEPVNIALILGFVILFVSLAVLGGVYFYKVREDKRVLGLEKELQSKEASLKVEDIDRYKAIDARLTIAKQLLQSHTAFSLILDLVEKITAQNIGWTSLSYATDNTSGSIKLSLNGEAPSYSAVYVQAESWRAMPTILKEVNVSMPRLMPESSAVLFGANLVIDLSYVKYAHLINGANQADQTSTPSEGTTSAQLP